MFQTAGAVLFGALHDGAASHPRSDVSAISVPFRDSYRAISGPVSHLEYRRLSHKDPWRPGTALRHHIRDYLRCARPSRRKLARIYRNLDSLDSASWAGQKGLGALAPSRCFGSINQCRCASHRRLGTGRERQRFTNLAESGPRLEAGGSGRPNTR